jgi:phosphoribosylaminoimidazole-succinocarboxamide synthase
MIGIENHFIEKVNMREQLVQFVDIYPIQVCVSTIACGRYVKDFGIEEGFVMDSPVMDFLIKSHDLKYPPINEHQILNFNWITRHELKQMKHQALRVHDYLSGIFTGAGIRLVECKLEFGRVFNGEDFLVMLADEITPDNCRLWDLNTNYKFGIEAVEANQDNNHIESYQTVLERLRIPTTE